MTTPSRRSGHGRDNRDLRSLIREIPDFPRPGILFRDVTPLLADGAAFNETIDKLAERVGEHKPAAIVGIESRGFIFGATVAARLGLGFVPIRKPGKLPWRTRHQRYELEYGSDGVEIHIDAVDGGARVVIVDDLLATGGTAGAAVSLVSGIGGNVVGAVFVIELKGLGGRERLGGVPVHAVVTYP
jgi:adenine phosphoribosyltransferase